MAFPDAVFSFPISCNVSTVILTDVAVKTTPTNTAWINNELSGLASIQPSSKNQYVNAPPPISGAITPNTAIINDAFPHFLSSLMSVSRPAQNIRTITPISDKCSIKSVWCKAKFSKWCPPITTPDNKFPNTAGPSKSPASKAPTTCGILYLLVSKPRNLVLIRISANCHKYPYSSIVFSSLNYVGTTHTDSLTFNCQTLSFIIKIFFQTWFIIAPYPTKFNLFFYFLTPI